MQNRLMIPARLLRPVKRPAGPAPLLLLACLAAGLAGCSSAPSVERPALQFTGAAMPEWVRDYPHWPMPPLELETLLAETLDAGSYEMTRLADTEYGGTGPKKITLNFPSAGREVSFKWKPVPREELDAVNNSLRREIAAYEIQKLFMDPEDFVVPTTLAHCVPLQRYEADHGTGRPSLEGIDCVLGGLSVWIEDVTLSDEIYEAKRFVSEPDYAYHMATFNLLTYLIDHRDARHSNFLISKGEGRRQVFSVDNGIAFQPFLYNIFADNWDVIRVAALRKDSIDRLRRLSREDFDVLGVVAELRKDDRSVLRRVPPGDNLDPVEGIRLQGGTLQFGLTRHEIIRAWERVQDLIAEVDDGAMPVF